MVSKASEATLRWRAKNLEKARETSRRCAKAWRERYPERWKASQRASYLKRRAHVLEKSKEYYHRNKDYAKGVSMKSFLRLRYGLTLDNFADKLLQQNLRCAMCDEPFKRIRHMKIDGESWPVPGIYVMIDHDHKTGALRDLLCPKCNGGLGYCETPGFLEHVQKYLEKHAGQRL